jgi:PAS domain S-box-containing protein
MTEKPTYAELEQKIHELEKKDDKYRTLFEKSKDAILIIENERFVDCNQAAVDMLGYKNKVEFLNTHPSELSPDNQPDGKSSFTKAIKMIDLALKNGAHRFEWNHVRANGEIFPVEVLLTTISYQNNNHVMHTTWRDITDRKQAEKKLREKENQLSLHLQNTPLGAISLDLNFKIIDWNPAAESIFGYNRKEAINIHIADLIIPDDIKESVDIVFRNLLSGKGGKHNTNDNITKAGKRIICDWYNTILYNVKGEITGFASLVNDVTEKKAHEKQLLRFAKVIEQASEEVVITDINGIIQYVNPSFERNTGYKTEEVLGQTPSVLKSGLHDRAFYKGIWTTLLDKEIWKGKIQNKCKDGHILFHDMVITPILDSDNKISAFVSIRRDITEQRNMEQQIQQSQKMESIGTLAGGVAHDFNNILSGIFGYAQLAEMNIDNSVKAKQNISQIIKGAKRATELVQQILTFSRRSEHKKNPSKLYLIVKEAIQFLRSSIPTTIEIKEEIFSKAMILTDPTQMHQIVMNLCTNAYYAMRKTGGILSVSLKEIEIREPNSIPGLTITPDTYLKLEINDTGSGMSQETLDKIFEPYFTTKKIGEGTGMGLAVVLGIVKQHNGYMQAQSELGKGSTFSIYLPVLKGRIDSQALKKEKDALKGGTERIMVVDDEESILTSTQDILEDYGYSVKTFSNGKHAFNEFNKDPYQVDLIITDMTMPKMTGDKLSYRAMEIRNDIPVILCTGYSDNISEIKALEIGIKKYLIKPIDSHNMLRTIREVLDKNKAEEQSIIQT